MRTTSRLPFPLLAAIALTSAACVTINVYFPEAAIRDLSQQIEEEVAKEAARQDGSAPAEPNTPPDGDRSSSLIDVLLGATPAHAREGVQDPAVSNPAIRSLISSRGSRVESINAFKTRGIIGENNQALLEILDLGSLTDLRERAEVQRLVKAENADREQLFKEIAAAEGVDLSQIPRIRETYAETLREAARPGDRIQMPDGTWTTK